MMNGDTLLFVILLCGATLIDFVLYINTSFEHRTSHWYYKLLGGGIIAFLTDKNKGGKK